MDKKLHWHTVSKKVDDLVPQEVNPRTITRKQMEDLKKSLQKFNLAEIPAIDLNGRILAGHQRIKALQLLGRGGEEIDVRVPNRKLTEEESKQYLIGSNALGGDWDFELLKDFELDLLIDVGFDPAKLSNLWDTNQEVREDTFDLDKSLSENKTSPIKTGDLITLGNHKLICGDSTDEKVLQKLFEDKRASMVISDPPYNINLDYSKGLGQKQNYGGDVRDNLPYEDYKEFLCRAMKAGLSVSNPDLHIFYWVDQTHIGTAQDIYREIGITNRRVCIWVKNGHNPTPTVAFNKCYEPAVYGTLGKPYITDGVNDLNEIMNKGVSTGNKILEDISDIWLEKRLSSNEYLHPTMKPPALYQKSILRCTKPGDIILDSFGGSGSTLIAGEQLKRKVYMVEKSPIFCSVIIQRWESLTGNKAQVVSAYEK
jgi:DNA modification methylase